MFSKAGQYINFFTGLYSFVGNLFRMARLLWHKNKEKKYFDT